jgi:hypothetical protein
VVDGLEDSEDYRGFEAAIIADYDAETAVERELVLRLACPVALKFGDEEIQFLFRQVAQII